MYISLYEDSDTNIGDEECQSFAKLAAGNLLLLSLWSNNIGPKGCEHLKNGAWKGITQLEIGKNVMIKEETILAQRDANISQK